MDAEAPLGFTLSGAASRAGPWHSGLETADAANGGCVAPPPPPPPPPPGTDPAIKVVNVSVSTGYVFDAVCFVYTWRRLIDLSNDCRYALGFATHPSATTAGRTEFVLCYETTAVAATGCAEAAAKQAGGAEPDMAKRDAWILDTLPPLSNPSDDRFQV